MTSKSGKSNLQVVDSVFKKNKALQVDTSFEGGGGAIFAEDQDVLVLSSVLELNEATIVGGAAQFDDLMSISWINNKELLFGNGVHIGSMLYAALRG